jgi:hypothetical protein
LDYNENQDDLKQAQEAFIQVAACKERISACTRNFRELANKCILELLDRLKLERVWFKIAPKLDQFQSCPHTSAF